MKRRWIIVLVVGCVVVGAIIASMGFREREPVYGGRKLSEWLDYYSFPEPPQAEAVRHIGTNALPYLVKWLGYERPVWKSRLAARYKKLPHRMINRSVENWLSGAREERLMGAAFLGFGILGPDAAPAVPELTRVMQNTNSALPALHAEMGLTLIRRAGFLRFEVALNSQAGLRNPPIFSVEIVGTNRLEILASVVPALADPGWVVRMTATNGFSKIAPEVLEGGGAQTNGNFRHEN